ncbi:hypothetical protein CYMTET_11593 [Cymbomonas tetramitiformis]|uniref:Uncharacterized protein n=1 Tax=Cymbomonas tetramitiformis TaxID=36881 RepID=A0AAE0GM59_9CHLO|nr:hypothetical protein CYMTET_11593 [Cymbomonas tetramitiformis]
MQSRVYSSHTLARASVAQKALLRQTKCIRSVVPIRKTLKSPTRNPCVCSGQEQDQTLDCFTTEDGRLLCRRITGDNHYKMSRIEDEAGGHGGMIKDWFLEGETANDFCSVLDDGTLVCDILEPGHYMISKVEGEVEDEFEVECEVDDTGKLTYNVIAKAKGDPKQ